MSACAIILAGGFGTRLQSVVQDVPKPMAPVNGKPFLDYQLKKLSAAGVKKVILSTGYLAEKIVGHFHNSFSGINILYSHENTPLGTGGAIRLALEKTDDKNCFVLNGDSLFDIPLNDFLSMHERDQNDCSIALRHVANAGRYGQVLSRGNRVTSFLEKSETGGAGLINGGIYVIDRNIFMQHTPANENFSIEKDFFQKYYDSLKMGGYLFDSYFIDIGIPEDYRKAQDDFKRFAY